jgi:hypothetical protein
MFVVLINLNNMLPYSEMKLFVQYAQVEMKLFPYREDVGEQPSCLPSSAFSLPAWAP